MYELVYLSRQVTIRRGFSFSLQEPPNDPLRSSLLNIARLAKKEDKVDENDRLKGKFNTYSEDYHS